MNSTAIPLSVILVAPQMGENIGAVARAMGNFGLSDLRIVTPRDGWPNPAAQAMAAHAAGIIDTARIYDSLAEAVEDCTLVLAATARQRDMRKPHYTPKTWCEHSLPAHSHVGLVFGRENNGLSNEEITLANAIISVPVHPDCPSINLAQSAAILLYEWFQRDLSPTTSPPSHLPAPQSELITFFQQLEAQLDRVNFWRVAQKKEKMWQNLRHFFTRAQPSSQEVQTLHGIISALSDHTRSNRK